jgi:hypothetical protein
VELARPGAVEPLHRRAGPRPRRRAGPSERAWRQLVRVAYAKVAEFQARGLVHFHVIVRLDGAEDRAMAPGVSVTPEELCDAIREAAARSSLSCDAGDGEAVELRFGDQLHTRVLAGARDGDRELCPEQVAAYVVKYSCKASHEQITTRDAEHDAWRDRGVPEQLVRMAYGVLRLSERAGLRRLTGWVHMLGFRGHFVTRSRGYSTTVGQLRAARAAYRARQDEPDQARRRGLDRGAGVLAVPGVRVPQPRRRAPGRRRRGLVQGRQRSATRRAPRRAAPPDRGSVQ